MITKIDDTTLVAYIDGELDPKDCAEVEDCLARDPALREKMRGLRESTAMVRTAFNHALYAPMPKLTAVVTAHHAQYSANSSWSRWAMPLAASLAALLIGAAGGYYASSTKPEGALQEARLARPGEESRLEQILSNALETQVSGTRVAWQNGGSGAIVPVRTFRTRSGQYCREFQITRLAQGAPVSEGGIACRQNDGVWKVRLLYFP